MTDVTTTPESPEGDAFDRDAGFERYLTALRTAEPRTAAHVIAGERRFDGDLLQREDPSRTSEVASACHDAPDAVVAEAVAAARAAQGAWAALGASGRVAALRPALDLFTPERQAEMAATISLEVGKVREEAFVEVEEVMVLLRMYCDAVEQIEAHPTALTQVLEGVTSRSLLRPYGVFGVISPFNYPMVLGAGPALAAMLAGNTVVLKPSHLGPRSMDLFAELLGELDLPAGVFNVVHGADAPGRALVAADIDGVAFTGSVPAGRAIQEAMLSGPYSRPVIAEMGGKNPLIVTDSADVEVAARAIVRSAFTLSGQRCNALSRVIATGGVHDALVREVATLTEGLSAADPVERGAYTGPLVEKRSVERFKRAVADAAAEGNVVAGGAAEDDEGYFVTPTVVAGLPHGHRLTREELFVPFVTITEVGSFDEAIAEANETEFGLAAGIFTNDRAEARHFADRIQAGCINVNNPHGATTGFFPGNQTFGGWKASGSTGKHAFGQWYVQQYAREQCQNIASDLAL